MSNKDQLYECTKCKFRFTMAPSGKVRCLNCNHVYVMPINKVGKS